MDDFLYAGDVTFLNKMEIFNAKVKVGNTQSDHVVFCGLHISSEDGSITVRTNDSMDVQKTDVRGLSVECDLSQEEETWASSVIGKLQWSAHSHRTFLLGQALANLTRERKKKTLKECNSIIDRFREHDDMELRFKPLTGKYELEVYGDSAFEDYNHQGLVVLVRSENAEDINIVGWQTRRAERRAWSILAAETHVLQHAMDKAINIHEVFRQLRQEVKKSTVVTDNLSLRRCLYSGRPTKEERLRKEFVVIRDLMLTESKIVRYVPGYLMSADCLTKAKVKENSLIKAIRTNHYPTLLFSDDDVVSQELMDEACEIIEMLSYPDQRNQMKIQVTDVDCEEELVNQLLHGKGPEFAQHEIHSIRITLQTVNSTFYDCF